MALETSTRGLALLCASAFFVFLAYTSTQNLESTVRPGVGTTAVGVVYITLVGASIIAPVVIERLGRRPALFISACCYVLFVASNVSAAWAVMIPAAVTLGLGAAVLWPAVLSYLKDYSVMHCDTTGKGRRECLDWFSSIFWGSFQFSQLTGSALIYVIIHFGDRDASKAEVLLTVVFTCCAVAGTLLTSLLPEGRAMLEGEALGDSTGEEIEERASALGTLRGMLALLCHKQNALLLPVYFYNGLEQGFAWCNFTKGMIGPMYEKDASAMIGVFMLCYAAANSAVGFLVGYLPSTRGVTNGLVALAVACQVVCTGATHFLLRGRRGPLFAVAAALGFGDALLNTKVSVLLSTDFSPKQHLSVVTVWRAVVSVACSLPFFLSSATTIDQQVVALLAWGGVTLAAFFAYCTAYATVGQGSEFTSLLAPEAKA